MPTFKKNKKLSTDGKGLEAHFNGLKLANKHVTIRIHEDAEDYPDHTSVVMVATVGEFGNASAGVPPRHFLSRSLDKEKHYYKSRIKKILSQYKGKASGINIAFSELGRQGVENTVAHIESNDIAMTGNKPSTIRRKGGDQPMVASSHLLQQIDYQQSGSKK